jgi:signal peptidase
MMQEAEMKSVKIIVRILEGLLAGSCGLCLLWALIGIRPYIVLSGSMEPVIKTGSIVLINTHAFTPCVSDIITYKNAGQYITHRVVRINEDGCMITKGDANQTEDSQMVRPEQVTGIVIGAIPLAGYLVALLRTPQILCLLALLFIMKHLYYPILKKIQKNHF